MRAFTVSTDGGSETTVKAYDAASAAHDACDQLWDQSAGEAFEVNGEPTKLTVTDEAGDVTTWNAAAESCVTYAVWPA